MKKLEIENLEILNGGGCSYGMSQAAGLACSVGGALWGTVSFGLGFVVGAACGAMVTYACR